MNNSGEDNIDNARTNNTNVNEDIYIQHWELFENTICNEPFSVKIAAGRLKDVTLIPSDFEPFLSVFKDIYLTDGKSNELFNQLMFKSNDRKVFVSNVLLGTLAETNDIVLAMVMISYRLRLDYTLLIKGNNGHIQLKSIENATKFLHRLLEYFK